MAIYKHPPEVHEFVRENCTKMRDEELAEACNAALKTSFTKSSMKSFRGNHGYKNGMSKGLSPEEYWKHQTKYPQGMYEFIRDNSWGVSSKEMAEMVNELFGTSFTQHQMKCFRQRHGIRSGETGWFQKGHTPANKGKKLEEYVGEERAREIKKRIAPTQFKRGVAPMNELPVGTVVVNAEGYKLRKKQNDGTLWERWEFLHRAVWREHHGEIPEGMMIIFRDGDRLNCDISNLTMVSKSESAALNRLKLRSEDPDLTDTGIALVKLRLAVKNARKRKCDGKIEER